MKPIRFFSHRNTVWYNLTDLVQLLLDGRALWLVRPPIAGKRLVQTRTAHQLARLKLSRLKPVYQQTLDGENYVDWVIFEHLFRALKPYLIRSADWRDPDSLFRQVQDVVNNSDGDAPPVGNYFEKIIPASGTLSTQTRD